MECSICKDIIEQKFRIIKENKYAIAWITREPQIDYHCMVLPKRHITSLKELTPNESQALHKLIEEVTKKLDKKLDCSSLAIINGQKYRTQPHLHYQIFPVKAGIRKIISSHLKVPEGQFLTKEKLKNMADNLR